MELMSSYKLVSRDQMDTCANYARLLDTDTVQVRTLYRYGKPVYRTMSLNDFNTKVAAGLI